MANVRYIIPKGTFPSTCRGCGAQVFWVRAANGVHIPVEKPTGANHWSTCKRMEELRNNPEEAEIIKT